MAALSSHDELVAEIAHDEGVLEPAVRCGALQGLSAKAATLRATPQGGGCSQSRSSRVSFTSLQVAAVAAVSVCSSLAPWYCQTLSSRVHDRSLRSSLVIPALSKSISC